MYSKTDKCLLFATIEIINIVVTVETTQSCSCIGAFTHVHTGVCFRDNAEALSDLLDPAMLCHEEHNNSCTSAICYKPTRN